MFEFWKVRTIGHMFGYNKTIKSKQVFEHSTAVMGRYHEMKKMSGAENAVYSIGGLILIVMIFSGFRGMLAAALVIGWLMIAAKLDSSRVEEKARPERREESSEKILSFEARSERILAQRRKAS